MMNRTSRGRSSLSRLSTLLLAAWIVGCSFAAAQSNQDVEQNSSSDSEQTRGISASPVANNEEPSEEYTESLGGGLISMGNGSTSHLMIGGTSSLGWDSDPQGLSSASSSGISILSPYVGVMVSTPKTQVVGQYQPTLTRYTSSAYASQTMHLGSLRGVRGMSPRLNMEGKAVGSYGQDSVRFLGPQQSVNVGGVAATGSESATYLSNAGTSTNFNGTLNFHYKKSDHETASIGFADGFSRYSILSGANSVAITTAEYNRTVSTQLTFLLYGQGTYYYGTIKCTGGGGGAGFKWQFNERSFVSLSAGPQIDSSACKSQQGFSYNSAGAFRITGKSQLYFLTSRLPSVSYLGGGLWQTSVSGGYQRQLGVWSDLSFDVSHITSSTFEKNTGAYSGSYFAAAITRHLGHGIGTSLTYRGYRGSSTNSTSINVGRNAVMFSLGWTPDAGRILQ